MATTDTSILAGYPFIISALHLAKIIGVSPKQLMNMIARGQTHQYPPHLPHQACEKYRWSRSAVENWLADQAEASGYSPTPTPTSIPAKRGRPRKAA